MTIEERWIAVKGRPSGFDYMRIGLAVAVLLWHSLVTTSGIDGIRVYLDSPIGYAIYLILPMFFALSGFLVAGSMERSANLKDFLALRVIRIFPALVVETILSALILGPIVTEFSLSKYFSGKEFYLYLLNMVGWVHYELPGVFLQNTVPKIVNGNVWTIPYELECYVLISALALIGMFKRRSYVLPLFIIVTALTAASIISQGQTSTMAGAVNGRLLVLSFFGGIVIHSFRNRLKWSPTAGLIALFLSSALCSFGHGLPYLAPVLAAYGTVCIGLTNPTRSVVIDSGDYSYGTYLYGAPIQQFAVWLLGANSTILNNIAIALPTTIVFALFSWWWVEKPFLKIRKYIISKPTKSPTSLEDAPPLQPIATSNAIKVAR